MRRRVWRDGSVTRMRRGALDVEKESKCCGLARGGNGRCGISAHLSASIATWIALTTRLRLGCCASAREAVQFTRRATRALVLSRRVSQHAPHARLALRTRFSSTVTPARLGRRHHAPLPDDDTDCKDGNIQNVAPRRLHYGLSGRSARHGALNSLPVHAPRTVGIATYVHSAMLATTSAV